MEPSIDHASEFVDDMLDMLQERFSPEIMHVRIDSPYYLDDPNFLTKVKLRFKCPLCNKHWSTNQGTVKLRFCVEFQDTNELQFKARIYKQKCKACRGWGVHQIQSSQKQKVAKKMGDEIERKFYQQPRLMMRLILRYAAVNVAYSFVFHSTNIGIPQLLEIPTIAQRSEAQSDRLFASTLLRLNEKAAELEMELLDDDQLERICQVVWDKFKKVFRGNTQREETHEQELCEACKEKTCVSGVKLPEIYHIIRDLLLPNCLAQVLEKVGIRNIETFKRYFDYDANDEESAEMEERIEYQLGRYRGSNQLPSSFSLHDTINLIVSLFRPREPESEEDEEDEEQAQDLEEQEHSNEEEQKQTE